MPYIADEGGRRAALESGSLEPANPGDLTYVLTTIVKRYAWRKGAKFSTYAVILGCLLATILEFYRRIIAPYEDRKRDENGDVY